MQVFVNKKVVEVEEGSTLLHLIQFLGLDKHPIAVAIGSQIVRREEWPQTLLEPAASISIITICKGG